MDLKKFEYQKAEYVKAFKILKYISVPTSSLPDYFLLDSGMPNMPFAIYAPEDKPWTQDIVGKYFVMYDDDEYDILDKNAFQLLFVPRT